MTLFEKNLKWIAERSPELAEILRNAPPDPGLEFLDAKDGGQTAKLKGKLIHSAYAPAEEAENQAKDWDLQPGGRYVVVGVGLGYDLRAVLKCEPLWVLAIESRPALLRKALEDYDYTPWADSLSFHLTDSVGCEAAVFRALSQGAQRLEQSALTDADGKRYRPVLESIDRKLSSPSKWRILVAGPMHGGSITTARYVASAFRRLGHRVIEFDPSPFYPAYSKVEEILRGENHQTRFKGAFIQYVSDLLLAKVAEEKPDLVFLLAQTPVTASTLDQLRSKGIPTAFWFVENYRHMSYWRDIAPRVDVFFTIQRGDFFSELRALGLEDFHYLPLACDPTLHHPPDSPVEFTMDISFAGAGYYNRRALFEGLLDYDFKIWGIEWRRNPALLPILQNEGHEYSIEEMIEIIHQTRLNLNLHSSNMYEGVEPYGDFVNPRTFEICGCGGFQLVDQRGPLPELFRPGREVVTYGDLAELRRHIDFYLANEEARQEIAEAGRERAHTDHTYDIRLAEALFVLERKAGARISQRKDEIATVGQAVAGDGSPSLKSVLANLPADAELSLDSIVKDIRSRGDFSGDGETIFLMLERIRSAAKIL